jgi:hypothetical protein
MDTTDVRMVEAERPLYVNCPMMEMKDMAYPLPLLFK